jgi:hypothetical protein
MSNIDKPILVITDKCVEMPYIDAINKYKLRLQQIRYLARIGESRDGVCFDIPIDGVDYARE